MSDLDEILARSKEFDETIIKFPTRNNRIEAVLRRHDNDEELRGRLLECVRRTEIIVPKKLIPAIRSYLNDDDDDNDDDSKGNGRGKVNEFIIRLIKKRPLAFLGPSDSYLLRDGKTSSMEGTDMFDAIGTNKESKCCTIQEYICYDEMLFSALIGVSVPTLFINQGDRHNYGKLGNGEHHQFFGYLIAMVGARFERDDLMEYKFCVIDAVQNTENRGYGLKRKGENRLLSIFAELYEIEYFPSYDEVLNSKNDRFVRLDFKREGKEAFFDTLTFRKRTCFTAQLLLSQANEIAKYETKKAKKKQKKAFVYVVGTGLGVWKIHSIQRDIFLEAYRDVILSMNLAFVDTVYFAWISIENSVLDGVDTLQGIRIRSGKRNPAEKISEEDLVLVAQYAWDSNSYPGNEYWLGSLAGSGDPAAACCSLIPELQNPDINPYLSKMSNVTIL